MEGGGGGGGRGGLSRTSRSPALWLVGGGEVVVRGAFVIKVVFMFRFLLVTACIFLKNISFY